MSSPQNNNSNNVKSSASLDKALDQTLRPQKWDEYIGQEMIKRIFAFLFKPLPSEKESIEHLLFYGPAGLGKTTLALLIAKELGAQIKTTSGPAIERVGDLASILTNLSPGDIFVHRRSPSLKQNH